MKFHVRDVLFIIIFSLVIVSAGNLIDSHVCASDSAKCGCKEKAK